MRLSDTSKTAALEHAREVAPHESVGLVAIVKGRERYFPCRNMAATPDEHFVLDPVDFAAVEDKGDIVGVVHSHPETSPSPSGPDRVACEKSGLPWHIVNPYTMQWGYCQPEGFELPYVGREFVVGVVDCYTLCRDWYSRELGLSLRDYDRRDRFWLKGEDLYRDNFEREGFYEIPLQELKYGDAILMQLQAPLPNHAAVYLGDQMILHHVQGRLSSRDSFGSYYLESTVTALRHESR
jgi:proteasome lid subunit RPN8/RPN11